MSWVRDVYAHLKVIGAWAGAETGLNAAGVMLDKGVLVGGSVGEV